MLVRQGTGRAFVRYNAGHRTGISPSFRHRDSPDRNLIFGDLRDSGRAVQQGAIRFTIPAQ
jgi:hypothetical protein